MDKKILRIVTAAVTISALSWQCAGEASATTDDSLRAASFEERNHRTWTEKYYPEIAAMTAAGYSMECVIYALSPFARDGNFAGGLGIDEGDINAGAGKVGLKRTTYVPLYSKRKAQKIKNGRQVFDIVDIKYFDKEGAPTEPIEPVKDLSGKPLEFNVMGMDLRDTSKKRPYRVKVFRVIKRGQPIIVFYCPDVFQFIYPPDEIHEGRTRRDWRFLQETVYAGCIYEYHRRMGNPPNILHLSEGHVAGVLPSMDSLIDYHKALLIYVNHSIVEAAMERFREGEVDGDANGMGDHAFNRPLTRKQWEERFFTKTPDGRTLLNMSRGAMLSSDVTCGVSAEHAERTGLLFPEHSYVIPAVLNGSGDFWVMDELLEMERNNKEPTEEDLVRINKEGEKIAFDFIKEKTRDMTNKNGKKIFPDGAELDPDKQTVWLVRRIAEYKSQMPILKDIIHVLCADRDKIVETRWGKMRGLGQQVVIGGIAPEGTKEEEWVAEFVEWMERPELKGRFVFAPGGGSELLKMQSIGGGVCVNCPLPGKEACGTSDQRKARNGGLNLAMFTGGPPEYIENGKSGILTGPYATDEEFYEKAPKDVLDGLRRFSDMFYGYNPGTDPSRETDTRLSKMMLESYRAAQLKVTDAEMVKRYVARTYKPSLRIKKFSALGEKLGRLAFQQVQNSHAEEIELVLVGKRVPQKEKLAQELRELVAGKGITLKITDVEKYPKGESTSFEGSLIVMSTDPLTSNLVDAERLILLIDYGINTAMREHATAQIVNITPPEKKGLSSI